MNHDPSPEDVAARAALIRAVNVAWMQAGRSGPVPKRIMDRADAEGEVPGLEELAAFERGNAGLERMNARWGHKRRYPCPTCGRDRGWGRRCWSCRPATGPRWAAEPARGRYVANLEK